MTSQHSVKARLAREIRDNPVWPEVLASARAAVVEAWMLADDPEQREHLHAEARAIDRVEVQLESLLTDYQSGDAHE